MEQKKLDRINELAKKSRSEAGLTQAEKAEQKELRDEYILSFKRSLVGTLENTYIVDNTGNKTKVKKK